MTLTHTHTTLDSAVLFPVAEITANKRLRIADAARVRALAESISEVGQLQPIGVTTNNVLLYGLHRLEAIKLLGYSHIEARVFDPEHKLHALLIEIDENLIRAELTELEQATQLAKRKELFEAIHGKGVGGDRRSSAQNESLKPSFVANTAQQTGLSKPTVHRKTALGVALADVAEQLTGTAIADNQAELTQLSRVSDTDRSAVVALLAAGEVDTVKEAMQAHRAHQRAKAETLAHANGTHPPVITVKQGEWWQLGDHYLYCGDTAQYVMQREYPEYAQMRPWYDLLPPAIAARFLESALCFADPPYNAGIAEWDHDFTWQHDYVADFASFVVVTPGISGLFNFARQTGMPYRWLIECYIDNGMTRGAMGFQTHIPAPLFSHESSVHRNAQDLCKVSISVAETDETTHKGRKPMGFLVWLIQTFSAVDDTVIDPFAGSGQTLLACEATRRKCITGEIDPTFCAEIITRWQDSTGKTAERLS